jgi:3-methyl-2-oxobutanoate hydroxymethyltransferase
MGYLTTDKKKITVKTLLQMKAAGEKITQLTAYDYTTAKIIEEAGIDSIHVGDSASNVMAGNENTIPITLDEMIFMARSVARACHRCFVVCDMPFGSYQVSKEEAVRNAIRIIKETGVDAVKIEGGAELTDTIRAMVNAGIPVEGHIGLTPQSIHQLGGYGLRGKDDTEAQRILADAHALDDAGCFGMTLEKVPAKLAAQITKEIKGVTIGIGAGPETDGQVLVYADALGMNHQFSPKFLRRFADMEKCMTDGVQAYIKAVKSVDFPRTEESY